MKVFKFGGASVNSIERIQNVAKYNYKKNYIGANFRFENNKEIANKILVIGNCNNKYTTVADPAR